MRTEFVGLRKLSEREHDLGLQGLFSLKTSFIVSESLNILNRGMKQLCLLIEHRKPRSLRRKRSSILQNKLPCQQPCVPLVLFRGWLFAAVSKKNSQ